MVGFEQFVSDTKDFLEWKGLTEEYIDFMAKADKEDYKDLLEVD